MKGREVVWGVPAGVITGVQSVTTSGIVQNFTVNRGGEVAEIGDEENDIVTRIDHAKKNTGSIEIMCEPDSTLPEKGDELTGLGEHDGIDFAEGRTFVEDASVTYQNAQVKKITVPFTHYPDMAADETP
ncbi:hypothetical protein OKA05_02095 [Luteolibacter arcticus]|uniref:Uncharacterized protein n=2 Tax=Luteolibacter arcticus TaxID=1581411 RepID=A0ABT3GE80_9BACT|nr:hypothetical protein [Luteolibacter arcticus]